MEYKSKRKDVTNRLVLSLHIFDINHLRSNIARCTTSNKQILISICKLSQSEISNYTFLSIFCPEDEILWLKISMHNLFSMHFTKTLKNSSNNLFNFQWFEFIFCLNFIIKLSSFQQLNHNIKRIFGFKHLMKFHTELMVKTSHDLNFLYDAFLSFILRIGSFFRKCFHSKATTVLKFLSKINRGEVTFSNFLLGFKLLVEPSLIDFSFENLSACLKVSFVSKDILGFFLLFFETDANWGH